MKKFTVALKARLSEMSTQLLLTIFGAFSAASMMLWISRLSGSGQPQS